MNFLQASWPEGAPPWLYHEREVIEYYLVAVLTCGEPPAVSSFQVIQICLFEGKTLVAVPASAWDRRISHRALPQQALSKVRLVEVQAARQESLHLADDEITIKAWVGFLKEEFVEQLEILEEFNCDYFFDENEGVLPFAQALVEVAQEHFAFFSADGQEPERAIADGRSVGEADRPDSNSVDGDPLQPDEYGSILESRMAKLEDTILALSNNF